MIKQLTKLRTGDAAMDRVVDHFVDTLNPVLRNNVMQAQAYRLAEVAGVNGAPPTLALQYVTVGGGWTTIATFGSDGRIVQPGWTVPTLSNGWAAFGAVVTGFKKTTTGQVVLKGRIAGGTMGSAAFTLPVGYRPGDLKLFAARGPSGTFATVAVYNNGIVAPNDGTNADISLDGCMFQAEM